MKAIRFIALAAVLVFGASACTKNFEDINTNPNKLNVGEVKAYNCFEPIIYNIGNSQQNYCGYYNNQFVQYVAFTAGQTRQAHMYQMTAGNWQTIWDAYARIASDANHMIGLAQNDEDKFLEAVGMISKAFCFYHLVTLYGDVPYDECFKYNENLTPAFESEEQVLGKIIRDLDAAATILAEKPTAIKGGLDSIYGDNAAKWRKFANSLKLRVLCVLTGINESYWGDIQTIINNPEEYPVFTSNADNAMVNYQTVDPYKCYMNPLKVDNMASYRLTERMVSLMDIKDDNDNDVYTDPRLPILYTQRGGKWTGVKAGCTVSEAVGEEAKTPGHLNKSVLNRDDMPAYLMDYSEVLFIEAEGVQKGKLSVAGETAKSLYEAAVTANVEKWAPLIQYNSKYRDITKKDIATFLASKLASYDMAASGESEDLYKDGALELILSQKWISFQWVGFEAFTHWRRVEYPILTIGDGTTYNDYELPTRFGYPTYTMSTNAANANGALQRMGGDNDMHLALGWSYKKANGKHRNPHELDNH